MLDDDINDGVEEELRAALGDLGEDQLAEVLAFCWVGDGTYEAADWDEAMEEATAAAANGSGTIDELIDMPMLASVLEAGLAAFDLNCDGIGDLTLISAKRVARERLPRAAQIAVQRQAADAERARAEIRSPVRRAVRGRPMAAPCSGS